MGTLLSKLLEFIGQKEIGDVKTSPIGEMPGLIIADAIRGNGTQTQVVVKWIDSTESYEPVCDPECSKGSIIEITALYSYSEAQAPVVDEDDEKTPAGDANGSDVERDTTVDTEEFHLPADSDSSTGEAPVIEPTAAESAEDLHATDALPSSTGEVAGTIFIASAGITEEPITASTDTEAPAEEIAPVIENPQKTVAKPAKK